MRSSREALGRMVGVLIIGAALIACAAAPQTGTPPESSREAAIIDALTPDIEALLLAWHDLDKVYKDIKFMERGLLWEADDRQLGYVQKAALYVQDAALHIHHRWEQLAVLHYIRPARLRDYLTLSVNGLTSSRQSIAYDLMFLDIYTATIDNTAIRQDLDRAADHIQAGLEMMDRIVAAIRPLANSAAPPTRL